MRATFGRLRRSRLKYVGLFLVAASVLVAAACGEQNVPTTSAMCGFIVGDGQNGHDAKLHKIVYPNQKADYNSDSENIHYIPCNSRNYIVNHTQRNANGDLIGDRFTPTLAYTASGTPIHIWWSAFWTPNEDPVALRDFYDLCFKYTCYSNDPKGGGANFSTHGWNGLLGENFSSAGDDASRASAQTAPDAIWQTHSQKLYDELAGRMAVAFRKTVAVKTGYNADLFCGSGNSVWNSDHTKFFCSHVRFQVTDVQPVNSDLARSSGNAQQAQTQETLNAKILKSATAKYGTKELAGFVLAMQDILGRCRTSTCVVTVGNPSAAPTVSVPSK